MRRPAKARHLVSMEYDDEDKMDTAYPIPMPIKPDFPCGLRISLTEKEFDKLGLDPSQAEVGGLVHMFAMARVTSCNTYQDEGGKTCHRVELQIEDLDIESEDAEA